MKGPSGLAPGQPSGPLCSWRTQAGQGWHRYTVVAFGQPLQGSETGNLDRQKEIAAAFIDAVLWVAGGSGALLVVVGIATARSSLIGIGVLSALVALLAFACKHYDANALPLLVLGSVAYAFGAPIIGHVGGVLAIMAVGLLSLIGNLVLSRRAGFWFTVWCGALLLTATLWLFPEAAPEELALGALAFGSLAVVVWRMLSLAGDLLIRDQETDQILFRASPVALLEEDFSAVARSLDALRAEGVTALGEHLAEHPDEVRRLASQIVIQRANRAALDLLGASSIGDLRTSFVAANRRASELDAFVRQFSAIWESEADLAIDVDGFALDGHPLHAVMHWSAPTIGESPDWSRVVVGMSLVTSRIEAEHGLVRALESNRRMQVFEQALATCSRSLLVERRDAALERALDALRSAVGGGRAFLAINRDAGDVGPAFEVVAMAGKPTRERWVDVLVPWSRYSDALETLGRGEPYRRHERVDPGSHRYVSVLGVPIFSVDGWIGAVGFLDTGPRVEWSDEAVRMLQVAGPMIGAFWERERTRRHLEDLVRSKDRFVASVSHELRTPLAAVLGFAEEIRDRASMFDPEELADMLEVITDQSHDMANLVEDLLVSARADIGTIVVQPQDVYLRGQAETVVAGLRPANRNIRITGGPGKVWADPSRTRQIIRNLLTNALRYGGETISVDTRTGQRFTELAVRDDGDGLPSWQWEKIFEPYWSASDARTQPASIGLGLSVARQLARLMDGDLVYRADEHGSLFLLTLPSRPLESGAAESEASMAVPVTPVASAR